MSKIPLGIAGEAGFRAAVRVGRSEAPGNGRPR